jgi:hypothetical protein
MNLAHSLQIVHRGRANCVPSAVRAFSLLHQRHIFYRFDFVPVPERTLPVLENFPGCGSGVQSLKALTLSNTGTFGLARANIYVGSHTLQFS